MNEYRIAYNPFTQDYIAGYNSHSISLYNHRKQKAFYEYIRGIIINNTLYLRVFYPYNMDNITSEKLYQCSYKLLTDYTNIIIQLIKDKENINISEVQYNVTNDILTGLNLINI